MRGICRRFGPQRAGLRTDRWPTAPHATAPWPPSSLLIRCRSAVFPRNTSRRPPSAPPGFASTNASRACLHASNAFHTSVSGHSDATNRNNRSSTPGPICARRRITTPPGTARGAAGATAYLTRPVSGWSSAATSSRTRELVEGAKGHGGQVAPGAPSQRRPLAYPPRFLCGSGSPGVPPPGFVRVSEKWRSDEHRLLGLRQDHPEAALRVEAGWTLPGLPPRPPAPARRHARHGRPARLRRRVAQGPSAGAQPRRLVLPLLRSACHHRRSRRAVGPWWSSTRSVQPRRLLPFVQCAAWWSGAEGGGMVTSVGQPVRPLCPRNFFVQGAAARGRGAVVPEREAGRGRGRRWSCVAVRPRCPHVPHRRSRP